MKKIILITFFFPCFYFAQFQGFQTTFTFSELSIHTQDLVLGYDPFGTDGLDSNLGETIVPQVPPGSFGVRFQLPTDTSIYTVKDIRFGCGQPFYYEHLIDLSYQSGSNTIQIYWNWDWGLYMFDFKDPFTGVLLAHYEIFSDSTHFIIPPTLEKLIIGVYYDGPITFPIFDLIAPNGGDTLISGENYTITWWTNWSLYPFGKLEYSSDGGNTWNIIIDSISHQYTYNYYQWSVPNLNSDSCLIRIGDYPCYYDVSDSFFTITYPVKVEEEKDLSIEFSLSQNYPNPFNPATIIQYQLPQEGMVTLKVYDILGREVAVLVDQHQGIGRYSVTFDASDLSSGIYIYRLSAANFESVKKMIVAK